MWIPSDLADISFILNIGHCSELSGKCSDITHFIEIVNNSDGDIISHISLYECMLLIFPVFMPGKGNVKSVCNKKGNK